MKSYFPFLDPIGFLLMGGYVLLLLFVLFLLWKRFRVKVSFYLIITLFLYYVLFFLFSSFFSVVPNFPDSELFAKMVAENYYPTHSFGSQLFYYLSFPLRCFSLFRVEVFILFQIVIFICSLFFLWNSFEIVLKEHSLYRKRGEKNFYILSFFYPSFLLFIPIPLREFMLLFGFSVFVNGLFRRYYNYKKSSLCLLLGIFIMLFVRPQFVVVALLFYALFHPNKKKRIVFLLSGFFLIPLIFTLITNYEFNPSFFAYLRNSANDTYADSGFVYGIVEWSTYFDIIKDIPLLFLQFILSPAPILHNISAFSMFAMFIDMIFCILIYTFVLYAGLNINKMFLALFIVTGVIFAIWEFYIGGAVRHRMPIIAILLPVAAYGIEKFLYNIKRGKI